jgi:hypothetical protein
MRAFPGGKYISFIADEFIRELRNRNDPVRNREMVSVIDY